MRLVREGFVVQSKILLVSICIFGISACAGRAPAPVAVFQPIDSRMDCNAVRAEITANTARISDLGFESGAKVAQNVVAGVAGVFFILPWFLMDFQGSAGIDQRSLEARNQYLATLANSRCLAMAEAPQPSGRRRMRVRVNAVSASEVSSLNLPSAGGLMVLEVLPGGVGSSAGLVAGDVILAFDGITVLTVDDMQRRLNGAASNSIVNAMVWRNGQERPVPLQF